MLEEMFLLKFIKYFVQGPRICRAADDAGRQEGEDPLRLRGPANPGRREACQCGGGHVGVEEDGEGAVEEGEDR